MHFKWLICSLCRFDRVQFSLFPKSHPRSVWSWHLATRRRLVQQQPDGPEVRRAERKCGLKGRRRDCLVYLKRSEAARSGETIWKHKRLLSKKCRLTECEKLSHSWWWRCSPELPAESWTKPDPPGFRRGEEMYCSDIYLSSITSDTCQKILNSGSYFLHIYRQRILSATFTFSAS